MKEGSVLRTVEADKAIQALPGGIVVEAEVESKAQQPGFLELEFVIGHCFWIDGQVFFPRGIQFL